MNKQSLELHIETLTQMLVGLIFVDKVEVVGVGYFYRN